MNHKFFMSFLFVFSLVLSNSSESFTLEKSSEEEEFTALISEFNQICAKFKKMALNKGSRVSKEIYLNIESNLKNKALLIEEGLLNLCTKEDLDTIFTKEDYQLLLNFLNQKYQSILDINDESTFKKIKYFIQKAKTPFLIEEDFFDLCTKDDLDATFTKEDYQLLSTYVYQKYQSVFDINDESTFKNVKYFIQSLKNAVNVLEKNNAKLEDLKKDNLKLKSEILSLQKNILNFEIGLTITAAVCIAYGIYQSYNKADSN